MIYGIGVDLVRINRIERVIGKWGERFVGRVFTHDEARFCHERAYPFSAFALRFAALLPYLLSPIMGKPLCCA